MSERKPILCLDFDGVIHSYNSGWQGAAIIPDRPVPGAMEFICRAVDQFRVAIYSSRSGQPGGIDAMKGWTLAFLVEYADGFDVAKRIFDLLEWPTEKPAALITIDDRAVTFTGEWPSIADLLAFRPWNKPAPPPATESKMTTVSSRPHQGGGSCRVRQG